MLDPWNMRKSRLAKQLFLALRMRRNLQRARLLHYTTEIEHRWVQRMKLRPAAIVEPLGLDLSEFSPLPPRGTFRAKYPQLIDQPMILFLGRVHYGKGLELLVPALAKMHRRDAMLVVAGPDAEGYGKVVDRLITQNGVDGRVVFTGMIGAADRLAALVDADLLAAPSYHENFGLAVIESLAVGTPVVISDQVNTYPPIAAEQLGGVVPLDIGLLARELDRWIEDSALRDSAAMRGPHFVREHYDWNVIARHWAGHYQRAMGG
jgi:glycosyltransferase involved in cell wall biosynthesis